MDAATTRTASAPARTVFEDALGKRHHAVLPNGEAIEILELRDAFGTPAFESAVRDRIGALAGFQNTCFSRVRGVQRLKHNAAKLLIVSNRVPAARLSTVLAATRQRLVPLEVSATLCLLRQLVAAAAMLHEKYPPMAHGALAPERIVITDKARLVIVDQMLGSALGELHYTQDQYWDELRIPLPSASPPTFDQRADVLQIGIIALSLMLDRSIDRDEYPHQINELVERAWTLTATRASQPVPAELQTWLQRMLQLDDEQSFSSAVDAWTDFERVVRSGENLASFVALESFMAEYARATAASPAATMPSQAVATTAPAIAVATAPIEPPATPPPASSPPRMFGGFNSADAATSPEAPATPRMEAAEKTTARRRGRWVVAAAVLVALISGGALFGRHYLNVMPAAVAEATGTLVVSTNPPGVAVIVDGQPRGVTPLTLEVAPGAHELQLDADGEPRLIPFTVAAGSTVAHTIELPKASPRTGQLIVRTEPSGARVTIDNLAVGTTPITLEGLAPGPHTVALATDVSTVTQEVTIEAGATASLLVPMAAPQSAPVFGWITVKAPTSVQVYEDERLLGTSESDKIMVAAGRHELSIVNDTLAYRTTRPVTVSPGKISLVTLEWPNGVVALNAQPWAEVWINGENVGETPIGKLDVPIGTYDIVFRHPQLGQQVVRATVTAATTTRLSVDMNKR